MDRTMFSGMRKRIVGVFHILILFSSLLLSGCATTEEVGRVEYELIDLRSEVRTLKRKTRSLEEQLPGRQGDLYRRLDALEGSQKATARSVSELLIRVQELSTDIQAITGRLEQVQFSSEKDLRDLKGMLQKGQELAVQLKELRTAVDELRERQAALEQSIAILEKKIERPVKKEQPPEKAAKQNVKEVYRAAYEAFKAGRTEEAREKFMSVLNDFPENEYSDNARFWIAESYYKEGKYEDAILVYEELFRKNPDSEKLPGAMLKQGLAFYALKDAKTGQLILERLIEKFPDSEQAKLARKKLKETASAKGKK